MNNNDLDLSKLGYHNDSSYDIDDFGEQKTFKSTLQYNGVNITINPNIGCGLEESKKHLEVDYNVLVRVGIENAILKEFIPWLKGNDYLDRDNQKILEGLKLYELTYDYRRICAKYSPTGKDDYFGHFEFCFESGNDYTKDMLEAVSMEVLIKDGKIVKVSGYDI